MRKMKKSLATLAIVAMVLTMIPLQVFATTDSTRLWGADRIGTGLAIADAFGAADTVILAAADQANLVDSLAVASLAGKVSPILLTYKDSLDAAVKAKLSGKKVIAVGAVSNAVVNDAKTVATSVEQLQGADRFATNDLINAKLTSPAGTFVVGANAIPDALSIASFAAANNYAIVLADYAGNVATSKIKGSKTYIIGGPTLVNDITGATRLFGADRFATNTAVVSGLTYSYDKVYVANGVSLVDALTAAPLAAKANAAILLTDNNNVNAATAVNAKLTASSQVIALGGVAVVSDAVKASVAYPVPAALAVTSVSAINAKQLKVVFTQAVDKTSAETIGNYLFNNVALAAPDAAVLQTDGTSVVITLNTALVNAATNVYQVNPIISKTVTTISTPIYTVTEKYTDSAAPTVTAVTSSTNLNFATSVKVTFSEPVASGILKIDGVSYAVVAGSSTTITGLNLDAATAHTLEAVNLQDYANATANITAYSTQSFSVTKDIVAPLVSSVTAYGEKSVLVTFSKAMDNATAITVANYAAANEVLTAYTVSVAALSTDTTKTQYVVTITTGGIYSTTVTAHTVSVAFTAGLLDSLGNALVPVTKTVSLTKDVTTPTVASIVAEKDNAGNTTDLLVTYSEGLAANGAGALSALLTIVDSNGVLVTVSGLNANSNPIVAGDKTVKFLFTAPAKQNVKWNVTVPAALVTDGAETVNSSTALTQLVDMTQTASTTFLVTSAAIAGQIITVTYPAAVKGGAVAGSATDPVNYSINGVALPAGTSITLDAATRKVATITLPAGSLAANDASAVFRISSVQDLNGNVATPFLSTLAVTDNTKPVLNAAALNTDSSISTGFSETVLALAKADLVLKVNGNAVTLTSATLAPGAGADSGKWVLSGVLINDTVQTFVDMNGDGGAYDVGVDILVKTEATLTAKLSTSPIITAVTIGIVPTGTVPTGADAAGNKVTNGTVLTVK